MATYSEGIDKFFRKKLAEHLEEKLTDPNLGFSDSQVTEYARYIEALRKGEKILFRVWIYECFAFVIQSSGTAPNDPVVKHLQDSIFYPG